MLPEGDYVAFGYLLSQIRLSFVCLSVCLSVAFVHPTQPVEIFCNHVSTQYAHQCTGYILRSQVQVPMSTDSALADHCARLQIIFTYLLTYLFELIWVSSILCVLGAQKAYKPPWVCRRVSCGSGLVAM